eukprot:TRINITY_DN12429_c0_g1_i1.p1 TRINITY_DN12429_c0_g1~~TRINITY_DN12429_c0_g1_i1.p1  ORF type:complete len:370 (+),score=132.65 TRINITY_DN12429_c0_g1_i1:101-1210(+)
MEMDQADAWEQFVASLQALLKKLKENGKTVMDEVLHVFVEYFSKIYKTTKRRASRHWKLLSSISMEDEDSKISGPSQDWINLWLQARPIPMSESSEDMNGNVEHSSSSSSSHNVSSLMEENDDKSDAEALSLGKLEQLERELSFLKLAMSKVQDPPRSFSSGASMGNVDVDMDMDMGMDGHEKSEMEDVLHDATQLFPPHHILPSQSSCGGAPPPPPPPPPPGASSYQITPQKKVVSKRPERPQAPKSLNIADAIRQVGGSGKLRSTTWSKSPGGTPIVKRDGRAPLSTLHRIIEKKFRKARGHDDDEDEDNDDHNDDEKEEKEKETEEVGVERRRESRHSLEGDRAWKKESGCKRVERENMDPIIPIR